MNKYLYICLIPFFVSCSAGNYIRRSAKKNLLKNELFKAAHTGINIFDAGNSSPLYRYQADKYFVPASNTKIFSLYAGLKYLGDSIAGINYTETADSLIIYPTGDPTLLHPDFRKQPVIEKLKATHKIIAADTSHWKEQAFGPGWGWDDYNSYYMAERSMLPVYGNTIKWIRSSQNSSSAIFSDPEVSWPVKFIEDRSAKQFDVTRKREENLFYVREGEQTSAELQIPFITNGVRSAITLLKDTTGRIIVPVGASYSDKNLKTIYSQKSDSLFQPMMYNSDNFFAEQTLLMVAAKKTGIMNEEKIINMLLENDLKDLPQKPNWVDGSGLSRYNLFTPDDFVWILNKMKNEFGLDRLKNIFATGGKGTLKNYYLKDRGSIFAKTGTLSGQLAISGYVITKKGRLIIFSVLINNHESSTSGLRKAVETFITGIRNRF